MLCGLGMLIFKFDSVHNFLQTASIIKQAYRKKEEAKTINSADDSVKSWQPGRVIDHIRGLVMRFFRQDEG